MQSFYDRFQPTGECAEGDEYLPARERTSRFLHSFDSEDVKTHVLIEDSPRPQVQNPSLALISLVMIKGISRLCCADNVTSLFLKSMTTLINFGQKVHSKQHKIGKIPNYHKVIL